MKAAFKLDSGHKWIANTEADFQLYTSPHNPQNTGSAYTRGTDLYVHATKNHGFMFYFHQWSMWQGEGGSLAEVTKEEAIRFLESKIGDYNDFPDVEDVERLKQYDIEIMEETA